MDNIGIRRTVLVTVYAPKSVDPTETTVLTPVAGALHSDPFQIANIQGLAGYQPFLIDVQGRRGRVNILTKDTDIGPMAVTLADPRMPGGAQDAHWFTQFIGDLEGVDRILECKVVIRESLDEGGTFPVYYTGRIKNARQKDGNQAVLSLVDVTRDAKFPAFAGGILHPNVQAYAQRVPLLPFINPQPWGDFAPGAWLTGIVRTPTLGFSRYIYSAQSDTPKIYNSTLTRHIYDLADRALVRMDGWLNPRAYLYFSPGKVLVRIAPVGGGGLYGYAWLRFITGLDDKDGQWHLDNLAVDEIPAGAPYYGIAFPAVGTPITWGLVPNNDPSDASPILVNDVTAAKYARDVLSGYYGPFKADGSPKHVVPIDADSFTTLEADATIPLVRERIAKREPDRLKYLADQVLKPRHLALEPTPGGTMRLVDMRPTSGLLALGDPLLDLTITDEDVPDELEPEGWSTTSADAIPVISATWYRDSQFPAKVIADGNEELPEVRGARIETAPIPLERIDIRPRALDFVKEPTKLDLKTVRASDTPVAGETAVSRAVATAIQLADDLMAPFGAGGRYLSLVCRRNPKIEAFRLGDKCIVAVNSIADPFTKVWGGPVAAMVLENTERGPRRELALLALGSVVDSDPPTLGPLVLHPTQDQHSNAQQQDVTPNAAADPVVVEYAIIPNRFCDTGDAPITDVADVPDGAWRRLGTAVTAQDMDLASLPSHSRVFTRARSEPNRATFIGLPSAWVYPDAPGYVDMLEYASPNTGTGTLMGAGSWLFKFLPGVGSEALPVEVRFGPGAAGVTVPMDVPYLRTLSPGDTQFRIDGLTPSTTYMMFLAHADPYGGVSCYAGVELTTPVDALICPMPAGFRFQFAGNIVLNLFAAEPAFDFHIQRAPGDLTGPTGAEEDVIDGLAGSTRVYADTLPITDIIWWHRIRHTRPGWEASDWLPWKAKRVEFGVDAGLPDSGGASPDVSQDPSAIMPVLSVQTTNDLTTGTLTATFSDPDSRVRRVEFQTQPGATGVASAWAADATPPYLATVAVADGLTSYVRVRLIGADATGLPDKVLAEAERPFPGRGVSGGATIVLHTADDVSLANARVLTASTEVGLDVATARQIKPTITQVPTTKVKAPGGSTPGHVLKVQGDGTSVAPEAEAGADPGVAAGTPGNWSHAFVTESGGTFVLGAHGAGAEPLGVGQYQRTLIGGSFIRGQATVTVAGFLTAYLDCRVSLDGGATWETDLLGIRLPLKDVKHAVSFAVAVDPAFVGDVLLDAVVVDGNGISVPRIRNFIIESTSVEPPPATGEDEPDSPIGGLPTGGAYGNNVFDINAFTLALTLSDGASVATWPDDSPSNNDAAPAGFQAAPVFKSSGLGTGIPSVRCTAGLTHGVAYNVPAPLAQTRYIVVKPVTGYGAGGRSFDNGVLFSGHGANNIDDIGLGLRADGKIAFSIGESAVTTTFRSVVTALAYTGAIHLICVTRTTPGGTANLFIDDMTTAVGPLALVSDDPFTDYPTEYMGYGGSAIGNSIGADYGRHVCYDAVHGPTERAAIKAILQPVWGTP